MQRNPMLFTDDLCSKSMKIKTWIYTKVQMEGNIGELLLNFHIRFVATLIIFT